MKSLTDQINTIKSTSSEQLFKMFRNRHSNLDTLTSLDSENQNVGTPSLLNFNISRSTREAFKAIDNSFGRVS